jgi:hypothetical protein
VVGPVVLKQLTPVTPVITQDPEPVGSTAPVGGETVAVKVKVVPRFAVDALGTTVIVGAP